MNKIKAFLIDPYKQEVTEIELEENNGSTYPSLGKLAGAISGSICIGSTEGNNTLYVDDEGLLHGETKGFSWLGENRPQSTLIGYGVIEGTDETGASVSSDLTLEDVKRRVVFREFTKEHIDKVLNSGFIITF